MNGTGQRLNCPADMDPVAQGSLTEFGLDDPLALTKIDCHDNILDASLFKMITDI
jgi:hypothetical protein